MSSFPHLGSRNAKADIVNAPGIYEIRNYFGKVQNLPVMYLQYFPDTVLH